MEHPNVDPELSIEDLRAALSDMQAYIDITPEDLHTIYALALGHSRIRRSIERSVRTIMTTAVVTLSPEADLHEAVRVLSVIIQGGSLQPGLEERQHPTRIKACPYLHAPLRGAANEGVRYKPRQNRLSS